MTDYKPGDIVPIRVGTRVVDTVFDEYSTQRFRVNPILKAWVDGTTSAMNRYNSRHALNDRHDDEVFNLNDMCKLYHEGKFTLDEWLDFYLQIGYSVAGFCDLSFFDDLEIVNPVWGDDPADVPLKLEASAN